jgi:hypothetical protein
LITDHPQSLPDLRELVMLNLTVGESSTDWCTMRAHAVADDVWVVVAPRQAVVVERARMTSNAIAIVDQNERTVTIDCAALVLDAPAEAFGISAERINQASLNLASRAPGIETVTVVLQLGSVRPGTDEPQTLGSVPRT